MRGEGVRNLEKRLEKKKEGRRRKKDGGWRMEDGG